MRLRLRQFFARLKKTDLLKSAPSPKESPSRFEEPGDLFRFQKRKTSTAAETAFADFLEAEFFFQDQIDTKLSLFQAETDAEVVQLYAEHIATKPLNPRGLPFAAFQMTKLGILTDRTPTDARRFAFSDSHHRESCHATEDSIRSAAKAVFDDRSRVREVKRSDVEAFVKTKRADGDPAWVQTWQSKDWKKFGV